MAQDKTAISKKAQLEALEKTLGVVTTACNMTRLSRETHYRWMQEDEDYQKAVDDLTNVALDFAESKLHKKIDKEDITAIIFYLKTKGKCRGYIERSELTGKDGKDLFAGMTDDEIEAKIAEYERKRQK